VVLATLPDFSVQALSLERAPVTAYIGLGGNLGDAKATVASALEQLGTLRHTRCCKVSSMYRTAPVDASGPDYVNAVLEVSTHLTAPELLFELQQLENAAGRLRPYTNAPRTLDLDLLLYGQARIDSASLTVPHLRMLERAFVLIPLAEIAPDKVSERQLLAVAKQAIARL
jgi:2-amino-4-hydroxy-6-hydroxymethyldihydropteridine diphosphokinase